MRKRETLRAVSTEQHLTMTSSVILGEGDLAQLRWEGLCHLNRLQSGEATVRDEIAFLDWRAQGDSHAEAFRSAVELQQLVQRVQPADADRVVVPFVQRATPAFGRRAFLTGSIAASATALLVSARTLEILPSPAEAMADYRTGTGEQRVVRLAGGATVDLNTRTSIALRGDAAIPTIELVSGEVVMTSGAGRSSVLAGAGRSVGRDARFSARRDRDSVCVTCLSGVVDVFLGEVSRRLHPHQQVRYGDGGITTVTRVDPAVVTAWQAGTLIFRALPMRDVVAEINRYRPGRVILLNQHLAERPLTGTYYIDRLDDFFSQAHLAFGVELTRLPGGIVVLR